MKKLNLAIFCSGSGTNLQAILNAIQSGRLAAEIKLVISNNSTAGALERARQYHIEAVHLSEKKFDSPSEFVRRLKQLLHQYAVELIVLAGYMKLVPPEIIRTYRGRIINIHPALLPKYGGKGMYGLHVHERVIAAGDRESGATVHLVDEFYDHGPILIQRRVPVLPGDTPETLRARVLEVEHQILPEAIDLFVQGKVPIAS